MSRFFVSSLARDHHSRHLVRQHAIDLSRLWKRLQSAETLLPNSARPALPTTATGNILILSGDASLMTTAKSLYDTAFATASSPHTCDVFTISSMPAELDLETYSLFFYDAPATTDPALHPQLDDTNLANWLLVKQRRLVILRSGTRVPSLLASLGLSITPGSGALGTTAPNPRAANPTAHYLTAGVASLAWFLCDIYFGGTPVFTFHESSPPSGYPPQDFAIVTLEKVPSAAEVLLSGSSRWLWQHASLNATWLTNLYPSTLIGGIPVV